MFLEASGEPAPGDSKTFNQKRKLAIAHDPTGYFTAMTASRSKNFKTYKAALAWLKKIDPEGMANTESREGGHMLRKYLVEKRGPLTVRRLQESFSSSISLLATHIKGVKEELRNFEGLIYYRLHGQGTVKDLSGEEVLSKEDKAKVQKLERSIAEFKKNVDKLAAEASELHKEAKALDSVMQYS